MRTTQRAFVALMGAAVAAVLAVTACNTDHSTAPPAPLLSQAQAESLAKTVVSDVAGAVSTATMDGSASAMASAALFASTSVGISSGSQCIPTRSPATPLDSDKDGVPDSVRFDYTGCVLSFPLSMESLSKADVAGSIQPNTVLPSGTWTVNGTSAWTHGHQSYSLTVTTNPPLHYNASCTKAPRFDAGKITAVVVRGGQTMTITIQFTACGEYTVTRS